MNVAGHRLSTFEIESALVDNHEGRRGGRRLAAATSSRARAIVAFVTLKGGYEGDDAMLKELREHVAKVIGPIAKPDQIIFTPDLPKTRSGKIMRRLLRDVARGNVTRRRHDARERRDRRAHPRAGRDRAARTSRRARRRTDVRTRRGRPSSRAGGSGTSRRSIRTAARTSCRSRPVLDLDRLVFATERDTHEGAQPRGQPVRRDRVRRVRRGLVAPEAGDRARRGLRDRLGVRVRPRPSPALREVPAVRDRGAGHSRGSRSSWRCGPSAW